MPDGPRIDRSHFWSFDVLAKKENRHFSFTLVEVIFVLLDVYEREIAGLVQRRKFVCNKRHELEQPSHFQ